MTTNNLPQNIVAARKALRVLSSIRTRFKPLATSTDAKYRGQAKTKIDAANKRTAEIRAAFPELDRANRPKAAKRPVRDELTGKLEVDRALVLERLRSMDELIIEQVVRIFTSHATRKGLDEVSALIATVAEPEADEEEPAPKAEEEPEGEDEGQPETSAAPEAVSPPSEAPSPAGNGATHEPEAPKPDVAAELANDAAFHRRTGRRGRRSA